MRGLVHETYAVQVADGLDVGQDARADHQGQHVDGHQQCGTDSECDQHPCRYLGVTVELDLHHGHLEDGRGGYSVATIGVGTRQFYKY